MENVPDNAQEFFIHDLVVNISSLSIKSVVGAKTRGTVKNDGVVRDNNQDCKVNWFIQSRCFFRSDKWKVLSM